MGQASGATSRRPLATRVELDRTLAAGPAGDPGGHGEDHRFLKHYRRVATQFEKSARNDLAFAHAASLVILGVTVNMTWQKALPLAPPSLK